MLTQKNNLSHSYACLQQPQTIDILSFISCKDNIITFNSAQPEQNKKDKNFKFDKIYNRNQKLKHAFNNEINQMASRLIQGQNQTAFIYGTQESKKNKIFIGQSQNPGLLPLLLEEIFTICSQKQLENSITIKLSCMMYKDGKFNDVYGATQEFQKDMHNNNNNSTTKINNILCNDMHQQCYLLGIPEIIIRNMKTALKIIKIFTKKIADRRQLQQESTQNLIVTIKLQIDNNYDSNGNVNELNIAKFYIVRLGNPSISDPLNGISKNNQWLINILNFLQNRILNSIQHTKQIINIQNQDQFTKFIKNCILKNIYHIYNFISITNKMNSNQCLAALIFNNYLQNFKTNSSKYYININTLQTKKQYLEMKILQNYIKFKNNKNKYLIQNKKYINEQILVMQYNLIMFYKYIISINQLMYHLNIVQYQWANVLTDGCIKLNKYIYNEEIQAFYYAKKISLNISKQLKDALLYLYQKKLWIKDIQNNINHKINELIKKIGNSYNEKEKNMNEQKILYEELFNIYDTMSYHFLYSNNQTLIHQLVNQLRLIELSGQKLLLTEKNQPEKPVNYQLNKDQQNLMKNQIIIGSNIIKTISRKYINQNLSEDQKNAVNQQNRQYLQEQLLLNRTKNQQSQISKFLNKKQSSLLQLQNHDQNQQYSLKNLNNKFPNKFSKGYLIRKKNDQVTKMFTNLNASLSLHKLKNIHQL